MENLQSLDNQMYGHRVAANRIYRDYHHFHTSVCGRAKKKFEFYIDIEKIYWNEIGMIFFLISISLKMKEE